MSSRTEAQIVKMSVMSMPTDKQVVYTNLSRIPSLEWFGATPGLGVFVCLDVFLVNHTELISQYVLFAAK